MRRSIFLSLYLLLSTLGTGLARRIIQRRLAAGKESPERYLERFGHAGRPRPPGRLIWFHAASVGEALSVLEVIERLIEAFDDVHVMVTTVTRTSAEVLQQRLPERAFHQFAVVDASSSIKRFLDHWQPDLAVWTESELWPALLVRTRQRRIPMLLINARVSADSFRRYRWMGRFFAALTDRFDGILAQDDAAANRFYRLGARADRIRVPGSLKETAAPLPYEPAEQNAIMAQLKGRPVWLAASTHPGEEDIAVQAHSVARLRAHRLALILAPRHPERGPEIAASLREQGWSVCRRSQGDKIVPETDIYLADTIGEMGLWYRIAAVSFVGGSLVDVGGHNPVEPAQLGSAILHGPHVSNFESIYARLSKADGAILVPTPDDLGPELAATLPADRSAALAAAAWRVVSEESEVVERVMNVLVAHLPGGEVPLPPAAQPDLDQQ